MSSLLRISALSSVSIPGRALVKKKPTGNPVNRNTEIVTRLVPFIPPDQIRETMKFLSSKSSQTALFDLIFHPHPDQAIIPEKARQEYQMKLEEYKFKNEEFLRDFRQHEERQRKSMWNAIQELPEDLYDEAAASESSAPPEDIRYSQRYSKQFYIGERTAEGKQVVEPELTESELRELQVFQNLIFVRYPHAVMKAMRPEKFWIPDTQAISRQKEAAARNKAKPGKKK